MTDVSHLRVSANGHYFVGQDNRPFFWLGDTAWPLFAQYERTQAERYLEHRAKQGFTLVKGTLAWSGGTGFEAQHLIPNHAGHVPWVDSPAQPNDDYFQHVDHLVHVAAHNGLILNLLPNWGYHVNGAHLFNTETAKAYGLWLGRRYRNHPNIVWVLGGDRTPLGFEEIYRAMAAGLREGNEGSHLITYHSCGMTSSSYYFHQETWLDFNMLQTWTQWDRVYPAVLTDRLMSPPKPVVMDEGAYEDGPEYPLGPITPLLVRRQAWWTHMAGGFHTYGHNAMWRMEGDWLAALDAPGAAQMTHFKDIATLLPWSQMIPDQSLFASGVSSEMTLNAALCAADRSCGMVYLSHQCHVLLYVNMIAGGQVRATWVDPRTGVRQAAGLYSAGDTSTGFVNQNTVWFKTPDYWEDAVLLLEAR
jgi:hypothetical protein